MLPSRIGADCDNFRGCRVRICVFATTSWPDIHRLLRTTITICQKLKICNVKPVKVDPALLARQDEVDEMVVEESTRVDGLLLNCVQTLSKVPRKTTHRHGAESEVLDAGINALKKYGVGPCSARWFYGSFDIFIDLEQKLANLYPSLIKQSGKCRGKAHLDAITS